MGTKVKLLVFLAALFVARHSEAEVIRVSAEKVNLREQPATNSSIVTTVPRGTLLGVLERSGSWYKVKVLSSGVVGYIHNALVDSTGQTYSDADPASASPAPTASTPVPTVSQPSQPSSTTARRESPPASSSDAGPFGIGLVNAWGGFALSPMVDLGERASILGLFQNAGITGGGVGLNAYHVAGLVLVRFPVNTSSDAVSVEPFAGGGAALIHWGGGGFSENMTGYGGAGGARISFPSFPHLKVTGGITYLRFGLGAGDFSFAVHGMTGFIGAHYFF